MNGSFVEYNLPVVLVAGLYLERLREVTTKRNTVAGQRQETLTLKLFILCGVMMCFGGMMEYYARGRGFDWRFALVGLMIGIASIVIRRGAIAALGQFWSLHVEMREGHQFVSAGPFRWMRHPTYFSMILELLGPALILRAYQTLAVVAVLFVPILCWRLAIEERALHEQFGATYEDYRRTTPMLFPWRWPRA